MIGVIKKGPASLAFQDCVALTNIDGLLESHLAGVVCLLARHRFRAAEEATKSDRTIANVNYPIWNKNTDQE